MRSFKRFWWLFCLFALIFIVSCDDCKKNCELGTEQQHVPSHTMTHSSKLDKGAHGAEPQIIGAGILLMVGGAYLSFMGFLFLRPTVFIFGYFIGSFIAWFLLQLFEPERGFPNANNLYLSVCLGSGFVVGVLFALFYQPVIFIVGISTGALLYTFICTWRDDFLIHGLYQRMILMSVLMTLFFLFMLQFEFITLVFSFSLLGGYTFMLGLDMMVKKGFYNGFALLWDFNQGHNRQSEQKLNLIHTKRFVTADYQVKWEVVVFLCSIIAWVVITSVWQIWYNRGCRFGVRIIRNSNDTLEKIK